MPKLAAALAYYTVFSLVPLLVIVVAGAALLYGPAAARGEVAKQISGLVGPTAADAIQGIILTTDAQPGGLLATILGVLFLVYGGSVVFFDLQESLDIIWRITPHPRGSFWRKPRNWLMSVAVAVGMGTLILLALLLTTLLAAADRRASDGPWLGRSMVAWTLSFALAAVLFAAVFKFLPDVRVPWPSVWVGALATAALFTAGKFLLALGLRAGMTGTAYGAAASLVLMLIWFYYFAQILYFGAELSQVHATRIDSMKPMAKS